MHRSSLNSEGAYAGTIRGRDRLALLAYLVTFLCLILAVTFVAIGVGHVSTLFIAALMWGWAEVDGLCGVSHVCSLTPLRAFRPTSIWLKAAAAYTIGGCATAAAMGWAIGVVGKLLPLGASLVLPLLVALAILMILRELAILRFRLPQVRRQTHKMWADRFGFTQGAAMWGAHIGLGVATVIRHGGLYVVVGAAVVLPPLLAALLFATFWLGRALPMWLIPTVSNSVDGDHLMHEILSDSVPFRVVAIAAYLLAIFGLTLQV
jgi:hypothetical protein